MKEKPIKVSDPSQPVKIAMLAAGLLIVLVALVRIGSTLDRIEINTRGCSIQK